MKQQIKIDTLSLDYLKPNMTVLSYTVDYSYETSVSVKLLNKLKFA